MLNARSYFSVAAGTAAQWTAASMTVPAEVSANYTVTVAADNTVAPPTYTVTATPQTAQASNDTKCGTLTLTDTGVKGRTGTSTVLECWR